MSGWASHLVLGSTGLALTVLATALVLRVWRGLPIASYRLAVAVLAAALALPLAQLGARALGLPIGHPVRALVERLRAAPVEPVAEPVAQLVAHAGEVQAEPAERLQAATPTLAIDPALLALVLLGQETEEQAPTPPPPTAGVPAPGSARGVPWKGLIGAVYALGALLALGHTARRLMRTRSLLRSARPVRDARVRSAWREVSAGSRLRGQVRLLISDEVRAPACFGLGRPAIVLPADEDLARRRDVLACVLTHELVHLERHDGWVLLGEELLRALFWFHPATWWLVGRLERLREVSCDLLVVRRTGKRRRYAQALVEYAAWMTAGERVLGGRAGQAAAVVPWSGSKGQLTRRIEMLLSNQAPTSGRARYVAPAAVGLVFTFLWSGQLALASAAPQDKPHEPHAHAAQEAHAEHQVTTTIEAKGGVIVTTQGADGQKASLHTQQLELKPGRQIMVVRDGKTVELMDALAQDIDAPIGIVVGEADDALAAQIGEDKQRVVVVSSVVPGSRASKAGFQEHDVIVSVNGKSGDTRALIDYAKQALRNGQDVQVVVVRKGQRKPMVLSAGGDGASAVWVTKQAQPMLIELEPPAKGEKRASAVWIEGPDGEKQVMDLAPAKDKHMRLKVQVDGQGHYEVVDLAEGAEECCEGEQEVEVVFGEWDDVIGLGGGAGGKVEAEVDGGPGEHEVETFVFGLGEDGLPARILTDGTFRIHEGEETEAGGGEHRVQVFGIDGQGRVVSRKQTVRTGPDGKQVIELQLEVEGDEPGERVIELQLEGDELGRVLRKEVDEYYDQVDPEDFHKEVQEALKVYESKRKDFVTQEELQQIKKLQVYAQKDAQEALAQARKALEGITDEELAARTKKALQHADLALPKGGYRIYSDGKTYELRETETVAVPPAKIEALKQELEATRKQLEVQRKQIEDLKRALEKLGRERELR